MSNGDTSDHRGVKSELIALLVSTGCVNFGQFTLKSGQSSSYYVDLRELTMHRKLRKQMVAAIKSVIKQDNNGLEDVAIVGVPYGVVPLASFVANETDLLYYPVRKEVKGYGKKIESVPSNIQKFILIEDVMSSGSSIIETIKKLDTDKVTDVIVMVDREAGGEENLKKEFPNVKLHSILRASELLNSCKN